MRLYRALLHVLPRSFQAEYGAEMMKDFARLWQQAATPSARAQLACTAAADVAVTGIRMHVDVLAQDLRYSIRSLRRTPAFTLTAILVCAIGIGATTATFTLADHVLIRALPFQDADRLVRLWQDQSARGYGQLEPSPPNFLDWKRQATVFDRLEAFSTWNAALTGQGEAARVAGARVTPGMFAMLGRQAAVGRILVESDVTASERPVVISDRLWHRLFNADPDVLGHTLTLDDERFTIAGVMPPDFFFPTREIEYWHLTRFSADNGDDDRENFYLGVLGRLKAGVTLEQARAETDAIASSLQREYPKVLQDSGILLLPWRNQVARQPRLLLLGLVGASVCVLLIAATNLANLLMSRAVARQPEMAIRAAIGASVDRLVRQMLTDSLVLSVCGGGLGVVVAVAIMPVLVRLVPTTLPIAELPPLDLRMLLGALLVTVVTGLAFGLLPALRASRAIENSAMKDGTRGGTQSRHTDRVRSGLVVAEIVACVVLIVGVALLSQAVLAVQRVDPGFTADNVLTLQTPLPGSRYGELDSRTTFYARVLDRVQALPGVTAASYISFLPMTMRGGIWEVLSPHPDPSSPGGFAPMDPTHNASASLRFVTPGFFRAIGTPLVKGRDVSQTDTLNAALVAVVSESFAQKYFAGQDAIGQSFAIGLDARTIVGIVGDIKVRGLERTSEPQVYAPAAQQRTLFGYAPKDLVVRATVPVMSLLPAVRSLIREADPDVPIANVRTLEAVVAGETEPRMVQLRVLGGFAAIAVLLAAVGIHGLLAFTVAARVREFGVRMALGATARDILLMVMRRSAVWAVVGAVVGTVVAYAAGRALESLLFGVSPSDTVAYAVAVLVTTIMTMVGSVIPAWRAMRIDPIAAMRID